VKKKQRDQQAIQAIQNALKNPRVPSYRLIECEFPILQSLNKLNDGSIQSTNDAVQANIQFCNNLINQLQSPFQKVMGGSGPKLWFLLSTTCTKNVLQQIQQQYRTNPNVIVHTLQNGIPTSLKSRDTFVLMTPCISNDYQSAKQLVMNGNSVILINGLAKVRDSVLYLYSEMVWLSVFLLKNRCTSIRIETLFLQ
jgi:hypothetical protein